MKVGDTIYADYQASTPVDPRVRAVISAAEDELFANPHAADHVLGWRAAAALHHASELIAAYFGYSADEMLFTSGASESNAIAINAASTYAHETDRRKLIFGGGDHKSVLREVERTKLDTFEISLNNAGAPDTQELKKIIKTDVSMVSVIGVNNENGAISDIESISQLCADHGVLLHVDMAQGALAMQADLLDLGVSFVTLSSHKVYGPKGIGALLFSSDVGKFIKPLILGGGQQEGRRGGTVPTPLCLGFAEAIKIMEEDGEAERIRIRQFRDDFVSQISQLGLGQLVGASGERHPGNALIRFPGSEASDLLARMQPAVAAASQSACSSGEIEPSHVLLAMGLDQHEAQECVRFSFGRFTDAVQIQELVAVLQQTLAANA